MKTSDFAIGLFACFFLGAVAGGAIVNKRNEFNKPDPLRLEMENRIYFLAGKTCELCDSLPASYSISEHCARYRDFETFNKWHKGDK